MLEAREATAEEVGALGLQHRIYIPEGGSRGAPVVFMVHGRAGNSSVMWVFSKALERLRPVVIAPQAALADPKGGFSWWPVYATLASTQSKAVQAERLAEVERGARSVQEMVHRVHERLGTDRSRCFGMGFSQGGALVGTLSLMEPSMFRGVALLSGFLPYAVREAPGLVDAGVRERTATLPRYFVSHGTADPVLPFHRAIESKEWLEQHGASVTFYQDDSGHKVGAGGIKALGAWMEGVFAA